MELPKSGTVYETSTTYYWFKEGIVHIIVKKTSGVSLNERQNQLQEFKEKMNGKKICAVIDISNSTPTSRANREYHSSELSKIFKAIAFVSTTALGKMLVNLYLGVKPQPFPTKVFSNEEEAHEWIKQFSNDEFNEWPKKKTA